MKISLRLLLIAVLTVCGNMSHAEVILNEWNAVGTGKTLSNNADGTFGLSLGNGGNWFELLVVGSSQSSIVDMRGWSLNWTEDQEVSPGVNSAGSIQLSNDSFWSTIRRGTLLTFIETTDAATAENGLGTQVADTSTNTSFDPLAGDWHINISTRQEQAKVGGGLVSTTTNDGTPGDFSVGNDNWQLTINSPTGVVFGPAGEGIGNASGVSSTEVGKFEGLAAGATLADWLAVTPENAPYNDGTTSTFGQANSFGGNLQDLSSLQSVPEPSSLLLAPFVFGLALRRRRMPS
ncbi:PEP-CTERM sorting domain-containing protein [Aureliella helgolandensis]|nr:PEP-CTERM sorting domain-containing protein [Aureliella helgolandensis]